MPRYAAVDIGSNSIRMEAAEAVPGQGTRILASDREVTRLGESVFRTGVVSEDAMRASCAVLARMAELYRRLDVIGVRAVATSAIRDTRNQKTFLERGSAALGVPIEIISGREEARLIHLGVESTWPQGDKRALILDIGGGSAEIVAVEQGQLREAFSRPLGAVRLNEIFLEDDPPTPRQLHRMHQFIEGKLSEAVRRLGRNGWERAIATSATASAVASAVARLPGAGREEIDRLRVSTAQVRKLYRKLSGRDLAGRRKVTGIGPRRAEIIVPGLAVLQDFLDAFGLRGFYYSRAGVRDGIIADLAARNVGAERARLSREQRREVEQLARRFGVPLDRARAVAHMSHLLFLALQPLHSLPATYGKLLEAASYLADVGHYVSSSSHHKHSYYVIANSDLAGFTERERLTIAALCRYHRKALPSAMHAAVQHVPVEERRPLALMIPLVRLADNLVGDEPQQHIDGVACKLQNGQVTLEIRATGDLDLAEWGAEQAGEAFRLIYNRPMEVTRAKG